MKIKLNLLPVLLVSAFALYSCGSTDPGTTGKESTTTGWAYNAPENGGFAVSKAEEQVTGPGLVLIEGGTFTMGRVQDDVMYEWNAVPRRVTVSSFYMDETEVRNIDYREYIYWLSRVFGDNNRQVVYNALPDTLVWRDPVAYNEPYVEYYFRHPAYNQYPVVGVNWLQANDYCSWRTDRVNEKILVDIGYIELSTDQKDENNFNTDAYLAGIYQPVIRNPLESLNPNQDSRIYTIEDGVLLPKYRLPSEAEWEFAAFALKGNTSEELVWERRVYPWNGHNVRNDEVRYLGEMRANFVRGNGDMMGVSGSLNDGGAITTPVKSFWPNDYGLYCMAGNVNEWVADVYRALSFEDVSAFNPYRGNEFTKMYRNTDGNPEIDSLGRLKTVPITEKDAEGRFNYRKSDYRNYEDGDLQSSSFYEEKDTTSEAYKKGTGNMYVNDQYEKSSLVNDNVRVYKGGSWKDRAYFLSPGTRRFLLETEARDDLGFRCAMTRVGSPVGN
ncbi:MAG: SUMF1/EgtB/PvdO family nonheme iron enzyme [Bacteroidales bacterium]|nr:SUMF1/EgtB/PvdO family nonheme iron enzyme [Bacteroidales bacterium]MCB8999369.1 SUMF1/EgtB/PvdO family nonheme iron enzyme [Bacteroidales bacterium]MCB9013388.1 SUMF1/EgtB/PvdO family nonheme iron enzyme [Bacteroidales bacterium]